MNRENTASSLPAADVHFKSSQKDLHQDAALRAQLSYPINLMESDKRDGMISLRTSCIKEIKRKLKDIAAKKFPWHEVLLGSGLTFAGIIAGALGTGNNAPNVWIWTIFPILSVTCLLSYFFLRFWDGNNKSDIANSILEQLPKDDEIKKAENEIR